MCAAVTEFEQVWQIASRIRVVLRRNDHRLLTVGAMMRMVHEGGSVSRSGEYDAR